MTISNDDNQRDETTPKTLLMLDGLDYAIRWCGSDYHITFDVLEINGRDATFSGGGWAGTKGAPDGVLFAKTNGTHGCDHAESLDDAAVVMHGTIKWDGCSSVTFPETEHCMMHLCGKSSWADFSSLIARTYEVLTPLIGKFIAGVTDE